MSQSVFISYAREDDEPFVKRIHKDLTRAGFEVWWDRLMPSRRLTFYQEIADAIRSHDRLILVVGPQAAVSDYVRQEWRWALDLDKPVIPILRKGDYTHVPGELSSLQCDDFRDDGQYRPQVVKLIKNLRRPEPPLGALFGVPSLPPHFRDRPELLRQVKTALLADLKTPVVITASDARVGVHGMGGIGKSVLATAIAHDREVRRSCPDGIIWLTVGQQPNLVRLQHDVAHHLGNKEHFDTETQGQGVLRQLLAQKAVLLVLDDVWNARDAQAFDVLGPRCRALITTRDAGILRTLGARVVPVSLLTEGEALQLLAEAVGVEPSALPPEAHEVVNECGYLPLAVALCGGMVNKHAGDWTAILKRLSNADIEKIADPHAIDERHQSIWRAMKVSVDALPPNEQRRFAELAVFVAGDPVPGAAIATLWSHAGNLSDLDTTDLLVDLADRSLIRLHQKAPTPGEPIKRCFSLHDLLHDYGTRLAGERRAQNEALLAAYRKRCNDGWPSGPDDGYFYQHLALHLKEAGGDKELCSLLLDFRWLQAKLNATDSVSLLADFNHVNGDEELSLVQSAIRNSSHAIGPDKNQLAGQLIGRLDGETMPQIQHLVACACAWRGAPWLRPLNGNLHPPGTALLRTLQGHSDTIHAVGLSADGRVAVSGSWDKTLKVWDVENGRELWTLKGHLDAVHAVGLRADGRVAVSASCDGTLKVWDVQSGRELRTLKGHSDRVNGVALTSDGRWAVSGSEDHTLKVWDVERGRELRTLNNPGGWGWAVALSADGRVAVSEADISTIRVWDVRSGRELRTLKAHPGSVVEAVALSADGQRAVSGSNDHTLKVWDLESGRELRTLRGHAYGVNAVALSLDGRRVVSGSDDKTLKVWDLESGRERRTLKGHAGWVRAVALSGDGWRAVSGSHDQMLKVWDLESGRDLRMPKGHTAQVNAVAVSADGRRALSGSMDNTFKAWDVENGQEMRTLHGHVGYVGTVALSADGRLAVSGEVMCVLSVWDMESGRKLRTLREHQGSVVSVALDADGRRAVSVARDRRPRVWDVEKGSELRTLESEAGYFRTVALSADGRQAVFGSEDQTLRVWDVDRGRELRTLRGHAGSVNAVALAADGRRAVSGSDDQTLKVWEVDSGRELRTLQGHAGSVSGVALTADGQRVVSVAKDQTLKLWDMESGRCLATFTGESVMNCCALASDGRTIVVGERSGRVHFLRLENVK